MKTVERCSNLSVNKDGVQSRSLPVEVSNWEEAPGHTQNTLEGLHIPSGLEISSDPLGEANGTWLRRRMS